jgi:hypothetical protein
MLSQCFASKTLHFHQIFGALDLTLTLSDFVKNFFVASWLRRGGEEKELWL